MSLKPFKGTTLLVGALWGCTVILAPVAVGQSASPSAPASAAIRATPTPAEVPPGRILFYRRESDQLEHYFTINTDGTDEQPLFTADGCAPCVRWSPDGTRVWAMGATGHGTWSLTTMRPDGSDRVTISPPIETLNLGPAAPSIDGRFIAFSGWDETNPSRDGLYIASASPDLADLRFVMPIAKGMVGIEPFGVTPDGSHIVFFADRGQGLHPEGDLFVVNADGSDLRQLNPPGSTHQFVDDVTLGGLSPDGRYVAFGANDGATDAVFLVDIEGGDAVRMTEPAGGIWAVSWSPTGEWIAYTRQNGPTSLGLSLVRPDGTDKKDISANDGSYEAAAGTWSPDGKYFLVKRGTDGRYDLWIMDIAGTFIAQVTHEPSNYGTYSWGHATGS